MNKEKIQWTKEEVKNIDEIIKKAKVKPRKFTKQPDENFIVVDDKKQYDAFIWNLNFDWYDVARIIESIQNFPESTNEEDNSQQPSDLANIQGEEGYTDSKSGLGDNGTSSEKSSADTSNSTKSALEVLDIISDFHQIIGYVSMCEDQPRLQKMVNDLHKKMNKITYPEDTKSVPSITKKEIFDKFIQSSDVVKKKNVEDTKGVIALIDEMIKEISCLNEINHHVGVKDILAKGEVDENEKNIKIIYESELYILNKLKEKFLEDRQSVTKYAEDLCECDHERQNHGVGCNVCGCEDFLKQDKGVKDD